MARRRNLRGGEAARSIEFLGSEMSAGALALRTYAARQQLPHTWVEIDTPAGAALARAVAAAGGDLPVVITPTAVLRHATPALLAGQLGLSYQPVAGPLLDLVIVGAGPAGLAAAVYCAPEGLRTLLLDAVAAGGQAAASSRIENYLGFTSGISGAELTGRAAVQAQKFGARIASPSQAARLDTTHERLRIMLTDHTTIGCARDDDSPPVEIDADVRRRAVVSIVVKHELGAALIDRVPLAGVKHRLELIEARGRGGPVTVAIRSPLRPCSHQPNRSRAASATRLTARPGMVMKNSTATNG